MVVQEVTGTRTILGLHEGGASSLLSLDFWEQGWGSRLCEHF
jgi:hypothetical protein